MNEPMGSDYVPDPERVEWLRASYTRDDVIRELRRFWMYPFAFAAVAAELITREELIELGFPDIHGPISTLMYSPDQGDGEPFFGHDFDSFMWSYVFVMDGEEKARYDAPSPIGNFAIGEEVELVTENVLGKIVHIDHSFGDFTVGSYLHERKIFLELSLP